jgi:tetratricopeptide (TPR) repeat protein
MQDPPCPQDPVALQVVEQVTAIKNEANKLFAKKEYLKAIEQYDSAGKLLPDGAGERADLLCNKAACYYQMKRCVTRSALCCICKVPCLQRVVPACVDTSDVLTPAPRLVSLRFKDAVKECSNALEVLPSSNKALLRRAYSYEKQGLYKQALADLQVCAAS